MSGKAKGGRKLEMFITSTPPSLSSFDPGDGRATFLRSAARHSAIFSPGDFGCPSTTRIRGIRQGLGEPAAKPPPGRQPSFDVARLPASGRSSVGLGSFPVARSLIRTVVPGTCYWSWHAVRATHAVSAFGYKAISRIPSFRQVTRLSLRVTPPWWLSANDGWKFEKRKNWKKGREIKAEGERKVFRDLIRVLR